MLELSTGNSKLATPNSKLETPNLELAFLDALGGTEV
jgi:hypothetical protein